MSPRHTRESREACSSSVVSPRSTVASPDVPRKESHIDEGFFAKYTLGLKIGRGGFAQVRALTDTALAVKVMDLREGGRTAAKLEMGAWRTAGQHSNIVALHDAYLEQGASFFVMDRCEQNLQKYLAHGAGFQELNERGLSRVFGDLLRGLGHIHGQQVVHRDIKLDNVMVNSGVCKICDFGLSTVLPKEGGITGVYGTAPFMCPEMLLRRPYRIEVDLWSLGVVAYVLFYGNFPYEPEVKKAAEMKKVIMDGFRRPTFRASSSSRPSTPLPAVSSDAEHFARELLNRKQFDRVSAEEAMELKFIRKGPSSNRELPTLAPYFAAASQIGAFENRRPDKEDETLDPLLRQLHQRHTGATLPCERPNPRTTLAPPVKSKAVVFSAASTASGESTATATTAASLLPPV